MVFVGYKTNAVVVVVMDIESAVAVVLIEVVDGVVLVIVYVCSFWPPI